MLRAKTLLAGVVLLGTAVTVFALNSQHDGFTPTPANDPQRHSVQPFATHHAVNPSDAIAHLPKLAPPPVATPQAPATFPPTVVVLKSADQKRSGAPAATTPPSSGSPKSGDLQESIRELNVSRTAAQPSTQSVADDRQFVKLQTAANDSTTTPVGMPLPIRAPLESRVLRSHQSAAVQADTTLETDESLLFDPAVPTISDQETLRLQQRRNARASRQRAAARQAKLLNQKSTSAPKVKRLRHRDPFDSNRN